MSDKLLVAHLRVAERNVHSAELLIDAEPEDAAFLAQQAAEKLLKGVLSKEGVETSAVRNKHSLAELGRLLPTAHRFEQDFIDLAWLEDFATTWRYPTPSGHVRHLGDIPKTKAAIARLRGLHAEIQAFYGPDTPSDPPRRPG